MACTMFSQTSFCQKGPCGRMKPGGSVFVSILVTQVDIGPPDGVDCGWAGIVDVLFIIGCPVGCDKDGLTWFDITQGNVSRVFFPEEPGRSGWGTSRDGRLLRKCLPSHGSSYSALSGRTENRTGGSRPAGSRHARLRSRNMPAVCQRGDILPSVILLSRPCRQTAGRPL